MELLIAFLFLAGSLALLVISSDKMTSTSEEVGRALGWSPIMIGAFILAPGTSLPEVASSIAAVLQGAAEIVAGNIVGSNITNICLVLGLASLIPSKAIQTEHDILRLDLPSLVGATVIIVAFALDYQIDLVESFLGIVIYAAYVFYSIRMGPGSGEKQVKRAKRTVSLKMLLILVLSVAGVALGAQWTVDSVLKISHLTGFDSEKLAASVVALGTSLPEVVVTITLLRRGGEAGTIIGNIIGSNIFNSLIGITVPAFFGSVPFPNALFHFTIGLIPVTVFYWSVVHNRRVNRGEGFMLLGLYVLFIKLLIFP